MGGLTLVRVNLERRAGPFSLRFWGLLVNFAANGLLLYGAVGYVADGTRLPLLVVGIAATLACVTLLSAPSE